VVGAVHYPPIPFEGSDGARHLVYELIVTNHFNEPVTIDRVDVVNAESNDIVASIDKAEVATRLKPAGVEERSSELSAGRNGTLFLHVVLADNASMPTELIHQMKVIMGPEQEITERLAPTSVDARTLPVLGPPLIGEGYLAADACCDAVRHRQSILPVNGHSYLAQRYAIDYEQVNADNRIYVGEKTDPNSYFIYGDEAVAVADGTVVVALDGLEEVIPGNYPDLSPAEADGNSVVLDIGNGFFVNYAHFQKGSVKVKVGDKVRRGDVVGTVGNSGRSIAPHLHLHVMDTASPLMSEGLPYPIDSFTITAQGTNTADFDRAESEGIPLATIPGIAPSRHENQMVLDQSIVTFAGN
jgi:hypothetical protein